MRCCEPCGRHKARQRQAQLCFGEHGADKRRQLGLKKHSLSEVQDHSGIEHAAISSNTDKDVNQMKQSICLCSSDACCQAALTLWKRLEPPLRNHELCCPQLRGLAHFREEVPGMSAREMVESSET